MRRRYEEMTSTDLAAEPDMAAAIAVVPIAAIEQHGPHLPLGTDALIADAMIEMALPLLRPISARPSFRSRALAPRPSTAALPARSTRAGARPPRA